MAAHSVGGGSGASSARVAVTIMRSSAIAGAQRGHASACARTACVSAGRQIAVNGRRQPFDRDGACVQVVVL